MSNLEALGWNDRFAEAFMPLAGPDVVPGRVSLEHQHIYRVLTERRRRRWPACRADCGTRPRPPSTTPLSATGWRCAPARARFAVDDRGDPAPTSAGSRARSPGDITREQIVAANIDTVFLVMGLDGDFNLRRIERYLVTAWESGAQPVVLLTKADLVRRRLRARRRSGGGRVRGAGARDQRARRISASTIWRRTWGSAGPSRCSGPPASASPR